jgi:outer membrane biosynthesis protein TonB
VPTKTGDKVRIIVLGTGPDAETARLIAESDADVALAAKFTKTVTHLVIDDTVKPTEARVTKAAEAGVPVLSVDEFKALLVAGAEDEVEEVVEAELEAAPAETAAATVEVPETEVVDEAPDAGPEVVEPAEPEAVEPETAAVEEPEPVAEAEPEVAAEPETAPEAAAESEAAPAAEEKSEPVADAIDEPEEAKADPEKAVPSQAEAPSIETDGKSDEKAARPGLIAKIKSIFGLTGARK